MKDYDYNLPPELVADSPAEPRDASRLLVYDTKKDEVTLAVFSDISDFLPAASLVVLNDTKVVPARLELSKQTGGKVRILFLMNEWDGAGFIKGLPDRKLSVGDRLAQNGLNIVEAVSQKNEEFTFRLLATPDEFRVILTEKGRTPLPPYIHSDLDEAGARARYQTVFADKPASVAAPTASLHFTDGVFASFAEKGIEMARVTLHVGRGTFSPVTDEMIAQGKIHVEPVFVNEEAARAISAAKIGEPATERRAVIAAGTTSARVLESCADSILAGKAHEGETSILISPPYDFKIVDGLITNFHLPKTSLLMLIDAFLIYKGAKRSWKEIYELAIREKLRFYSFGDAMLLI